MVSRERAIRTRPNQVRLILFGLAAFGLAVAMLPLDLPIAQLARSGKIPGDLKTIFRLAEAFSHGYGALLILIGIVIINRLPKLDTFALIACTFLPGLIVNAIKVTVARQRPGSFTDQLPDSVFETFAGWGGVWTGETEMAFNRAFQSFPSGHTATAVGLAVGLSLRVPRGAWYFSLLALLSAAQRIDSGAHFPSDTFAAAGIACWCGALIAGAWPRQTTIVTPARRAQSEPLSETDHDSDAATHSIKANKLRHSA